MFEKFKFTYKKAITSDKIYAWLIAMVKMGPGIIETFYLMWVLHLTERDDDNKAWTEPWQ